MPSYYMQSVAATKTFLAQVLLNRSVGMEAISYLHVVHYQKRKETFSKTLVFILTCSEINILFTNWCLLKLYFKVFEHCSQLLRNSGCLEVPKPWLQKKKVQQTKELIYLIIIFFAKQRNYPFKGHWGEDYLNMQCKQLFTLYLCKLYFWGLWESQLYQNIV